MNQIAKKKTFLKVRPIKIYILTEGVDRDKGVCEMLNTVVAMVAVVSVKMFQEHVTSVVLY